MTRFPTTIMMTLYIFNPEHDIALASGLSHFTAPRAGRQLRHDLGFLPMAWARQGDAVLVDDIGVANEAARRLGLSMEGEWVTTETARPLLASQGGHMAIKPWGWDAALVTELRRMDCADDALPNDRQIAQIRHCSHRQWAEDHLLRPLRRIGQTTGQAWPADRVEDVEKAVARLKKVVVKAPWSSSGRGVRTISEGQLTAGLRGWMAHVIAQQGCIMVEPFYNKLFDTGMEFTTDGNGGVRYEGASLFDTVNGAYTGNRIDSEQAKEQFLFRYIPQALWQVVKTTLQDLLSDELAHFYRGMLGVDMMVVETGEGPRLHPCVELNLRTTMGHVALQLHRRMGLRRQSMNIHFDGHYHISIDEAPTN